MSLTKPMRIANVWAVGRNYDAHAKELQNPPSSSAGEPMIFLKAGSSVVSQRDQILLPKSLGEIQHELELAFQFSPDGSLSKMTLALDLTARDVQGRLKAQGHPWTLAKSFRGSCPIGPLVAAPPQLETENFEFYLEVNGQRRQQGHSREMIFKPEQLRRYVTNYFPVVPGDLLLTGTPSGVARLCAGDRLRAVLVGYFEATWHVAFEETAG